MDINLFVNITSKAWSLAILSSLHAGVPGRQAALLTATGAGRTAFSQSLDHLTRIGLLERNPGHGHPLRPEFRLTAPGLEAAALASRIQAIAGDDDRVLLRRSWTLPVLSSLQGPRQFCSIKRDLRTITDRALSQSLKAMEDRNWVERSVDGAARPPRSIYTAVNTGAMITDIVRPAIVFAGV
ncbi:winged helix-turn-helix transcriptional regulator [Roseibium sediminicola]|uniref:Winged helix-turn-helix transcriptional regulator n=1 Tax=Roseibium sediminicola TaxID=2933272 RepID=A0ABT0GVC0_9HYPH|nr:winged helix-turn-helix transcriptional regulator [Roseibium sp. CAU 1639]MCK7613379.1 winged helix-turn-helix transcriptional regulator [Roseibium sp. CAU 1639]